VINIKDDFLCFLPVLVYLYLFDLFERKVFSLAFTCIPVGFHL
jgi:hypothetical protein